MDSEIATPQQIQCFDNFETLKIYIHNFIATVPDDSLVIQSVNIDPEMRRPLRVFRDRNDIYYFAYGLGSTYELFLSRTRFPIDYKRLSPKVKAYFVEYTGLKMDPLATPEMIQLLSPHIGFEKWLKLFLEALLALGGEKEFINRHYDLFNLIAKRITASPNYPNWKQLKVPLQKLHPSVPVIKDTNIYRPAHDGRYFVSVDLRAANFQVLRANGLISSAEGSDYSSWSEFLSEFIPVPYFHSLKKFRLKALSCPELIPKKQQIYWRNILIDVLNSFIEHGMITADQVVAINLDEFILKVDNLKEPKEGPIDDPKEGSNGCQVSKPSPLDDLNRYRNFIREKFPSFDLAVELFRLKRVDSRHHYFTKLNVETGKITWKCVSVEELPRSDLFTFETITITI